MKRVVVLDPFEEYPVTWRARSFPELVQILEEEYQKPKFSIGCTYDDFEGYGDTLDLCREVGDLVVVIEELNLFIDCWTREEPFLNLVRVGRHHGVSIVLVAQRAAEIPKLFTSQSDAIVTFRQTEPRDLDYLSKIGHVGEAGSARVQELPLLHNRPADADELRPYCAIFYA